MTKSPRDIARPTVLVYRSLLLPPSETFIKEQIRHLKLCRAILVGETLCRHGLSLSGLEMRILGTGHPFLARLRGLLNQLMHRPSRTAVKTLRQEKPALLHVHFGSDAVKVWPLARTLEVPMLVSLHGYDINIHREWWEAGNGGWWMKSYPRRLLDLAGQNEVHFVAVSEAIRRRAIEFGIPDRKITVSYIGVDTDRFRPGTTPLANRTKVLFVGRLVEKKGCRYLLDAFAEIQGRFPDTELVVAGDGPLQPALIAHAKSLNVRARFLGAVTAEQVAELMSQTRVLCLPSVTAKNGDAEGFGIVLLEAQASGVPVVTSARGGATEGIIDGQTGFAHEEGDFAAIRTALEKLLEDDQVLERFGRSARQHVLEHLDIRQCTSRLEDIYLQRVSISAP